MSFAWLRRLRCDNDEQEDPMSKVKSKLNLTQVGRVCVTVADTDRAIDFYVDALGFEKTVDVPMGDAARWVEVALPGAPTTIALAPPPQGTEAGGSQTGYLHRHVGRRRGSRHVEGGRSRRRRRGLAVGRTRAADVLAPRPRRELADHRSALRVADARRARLGRRKRLTRARASARWSRRSCPGARPSRDSSQRRARAPRRRRSRRRSPE